MMRRGLAALLLIAAFAVTAQAQSLEDGMAAYERKGNETAYQIMRSHAGQCYDPAQFNLGLMYDKGQGVPQDYVEAAKWYRRAIQTRRVEIGGTR